MTGRTHDLAAFTAMSTILITQPLHHMSLATIIVAFSANMVGGLAPDIDQPTAKLWRELPAGTFVGKFLAPVLGGHRFISHSLLGIVLFGAGVYYLLSLMKSVLLVDMTIVWWAFIIGFVSHLVMDSLTREGVPWVFPIPIRLGIPPIKSLRIKTGGIIEKLVVFPLLMGVNVYLFYTCHAIFLNFLHHYIK